MKKHLLDKYIIELEELGFTPITPDNTYDLYCFEKQYSNDFQKYDLQVSLAKKSLSMTCFNDKENQPLGITTMNPKAKSISYYISDINHVYEMYLIEMHLSRIDKIKTKVERSDKKNLLVIGYKYKDFPNIVNPMLPSIHMEGCLKNNKNRFCKFLTQEIKSKRLIIPKEFFSIPFFKQFETIHQSML